MARISVRLIATIGSLFISLTGHSSGYEATDGLTLTERWELEKRGTRFPLTSQEQAILDRRQFLFVGGITNELTRGRIIYYQGNINEVKNTLKLETHYYGPSSWNSTVRNVEPIYEEVKKNYRLNKKPVILMGHSKGGLEVVLTVMRHPELILDGVVERVVSIQAPIRGSLLISETHPTLAMRIFSRMFGVGFKTMGKRHCESYLDAHYDFMLRYLDERYAALSPAYAATKFDEISRAIYYARSSEDPKDYGIGLRAMLALLQADIRYQGENDGVVLTEDQYFDRIGIDLGISRADHFGLTVKYLSNLSTKDRKAYMRALIKQIASTYVDPPWPSSIFSQTSIHEGLDHHDLDESLQ